MNAADVIAYAGDGEVVCPDCADPDDHPIFADTEDSDLYCARCDSSYDWDWGGWVPVEREHQAIVDLRNIVFGPDTWSREEVDSTSRSPHDVIDDKEVE